MTLQLSVDTSKWGRHVSETAKSFGDLIPVVKGNGYGFGRSTLMSHAAKISRDIAVGTIFEAQDVPSDCRAIVLTPVGQLWPTDGLNIATKNLVLTIGSLQHVRNLRDARWRSGYSSASDWSGGVVVKLRSSMNRYGAEIDELKELLAALHEADLTQVGWSIHPPLNGTPQDHATEVGKIITAVDLILDSPSASDHNTTPNPKVPWLVSHIDALHLTELRNKFAKKTIRVRSGTQLWLGDKSMFKLTADVLDTRQVKSGTRVGYRSVTIPHDGTVVIIGAGTTHGVQLVGTEQSPFHFNQTRLDLIEPAHMHTSMAFVPRDQTAPQTGDMVDVQQPLTRVSPDFISWI